MSEHDQPIAANLLQHDFAAARQNQRWVGDTSELRIGDQGKAYLAVVLDLFSRFVVGWAVSTVNDRHLTLKALETALKRRCPQVGVFHRSDQGSTDASQNYRAVLTSYGITCTMSRLGNCYDNSAWKRSSRPSRARSASASPATPRPGRVARLDRRVLWPATSALFGRPDEPRGLRTSDDARSVVKPSTGSDHHAHFIAAASHALRLGRSWAWPRAPYWGTG